MGNYANEYQRWLNSSALTEKEKEELLKSLELFYKVFFLNEEIEHA